MSTPRIVVGQVWQRRSGHERVRVVRVWQSDPVVTLAVRVVAVRCKPLHGGEEWWAKESDFRERFALMR